MCYALSVPPANLLTAMSYLPPRCEHISERAVEFDLMHMAGCYRLKLEQLEYIYNIILLFSLS